MRALVRAITHPSEYAWAHLRPWQRHSMVLAASGAIYVGLGISYIVSDVSATRQDGLWVLLNVAPMAFWGSIWVLVGCVVVLSSRWPPASKTWGYSALLGLSAGWSSAYAIGFAFGGPNSSFSSILVWGLVALLWWSIAGLINPDEVIEMIHEDEKRTGGPWSG